MRSSVSYMLSESGREPAMSHPDYSQEAHHHGSLLILVRGIGTNKPKSLQKIFERIQRVQSVKITESSNQTRDIYVRYISDYPVENNDWGDFQTHRRLLGLITIGKYENQTELNELCRIHESLKVKYTNTLYDSRCLLFGKPHNAECNLSTPTNFKSRSLFYDENDAICNDLEKQIQEFLGAIFWILESKRSEKTREKIEKIVKAPFEDFVGLDMESRNNKKRCMGRATKHLGDLTLQCGLIIESLNLYYAASETLRNIGDSLWLGAAFEGLCAASAIILYPNLRLTISHVPSYLVDEEKQESTCSSSSDSSITSICSSGSASGSFESPIQSKYATNVLNPDEITSRYRDAIINYSKYRHAGIIETEAALKAARISIQQNQHLDVSMFLQNVLYINLNITEAERVKRFETLTELYQRIGYHRKAAFCQRLAAWRHVAQSNSNPDWTQSYRLMLKSFPGHRLSLEPSKVLIQNTGWPVLQIDLLQQLVGAARRLGHLALATRHMTFLLQTMWKHLDETERAELAMQLQNLSSQCEGSPVVLHLDNGTIIPPSNLTDLPYCTQVILNNLPNQWRPHKIALRKVSDSGVFIFTPIHFGSLTRKSSDDRIPYKWVQKDLCEVTLCLTNTLPFELSVADMRLLTRGIVFESHPQSILLQPNVPTIVSLQGIPLESGDLVVHGYSTHTLGVKSNCEFQDMQGRNFPEEYIVNVIPSLPRLELKSSSTELNTNVIGEDVITSANIKCYNGETCEISIVVTNTGDVTLDYIECSIISTAVQSNNMFEFCKEDIQRNLPLPPNESFEFFVKIIGQADFVCLPQSESEGGFQGIPIQHQRMHSPTTTFRRSDINRSFRGHSSGQSSLNTMSLVLATSPVVRQFEALMQLRYSGGEGFVNGYCRQASIIFNLELHPSAQVTNWDVLPAETPSMFYLVLDVSNLTNQEMTLNYTGNKTILIESKETCRVPVYVERCNLDRLIGLMNIDADNVSAFEIDLPGRLCAEHITKSVNLRWSLTSETSGVATLKGISLSNAMLDLVTIAPLQYDVVINNLIVAPQSELTCITGQWVTVSVTVQNVSCAPLYSLALSIEFYQDYQNGLHNYRLETRVIMSGPQLIEIPFLRTGESISHDCSVLFFTAGRFKSDIQCRSNTNSSFTPITGNLTGLVQIMPQEQSHVWRFIPCVEITVEE